MRANEPSAERLGLIAFIIDYGIITLCLTLITAVLFVVGSMLPTSLANRIMIRIFLALFAIGFIGYWPLFRFTRNGQTPGDSIVGLPRRRKSLAAKVEYRP